MAFSAAGRETCLDVYVCVFVRVLDVKRVQADRAEKRDFPISPTNFLLKFTGSGATVTMETLLR